MVNRACCDHLTLPPAMLYVVGPLSCYSLVVVWRAVVGEKGMELWLWVLAGYGMLWVNQVEPAGKENKLCLHGNNDHWADGHVWLE